MKVSISLQTTDVKLTGLQLKGELQLPFLKIGETWAHFHCILCSVSGSHTTALNGFKRVIILYWTSQSMAWLVPAMSSRKRLTCG